MKFCQHVAPLSRSAPTHLFPAVEVHAGQLAVVGLSDVDVEGLALVDEGAAVGRHLQHRLLRDFPHGLVELLEVAGNFLNVLSKHNGKI